MQNASPARLYAVVVGAVLTIAGIIGFFYNAHFGSGSAPADLFGNDSTVKVFGILTVNGWHNVLHLATGILGLLAAGYAARTYALGIGAIYVIVGVWGFIIGSGDAILNIVPINTPDNVLHLALGLVGLAAGAATPATTRAPTPAT